MRAMSRVSAPVGRPSLVPGHNLLLHGIETTIARESELRRNGYLARYLFFLRVQ